MRSWKNRLTSILQHTILLPPTMGALSGALIGLTPFLRRHVVLQSGELNFLFNAVDKCGEGVVPVLMMMLGSSLASESLLNLDAGLGFRANLAIAIAKLVASAARVVSIFGHNRVWTLASLALATFGVVGAHAGVTAGLILVGTLACRAGAAVGFVAVHN